jgi:hypothetical protein
VKKHGELFDGAAEIFKEIFYLSVMVGVDAIVGPSGSRGKCYATRL